MPLLVPTGALGLGVSVWFFHQFKIESFFVFVVLATFPIIVHFCYNNLLLLNNLLILIGFSYNTPETDMTHSGIYHLGLPGGRPIP